MKITPPDHTKRIENCKFRVRGDICCNAINYLRPHSCNGYCVEKLDAWLRSEHPDFSDEEIKRIVAELTEDQTQP